MALSDEELWSLVDGGGEPLAAHLAAHPEDRERARELRGTIDATARAIGDVAMPPPERIAGYRIEREIGRGGGGIVYEAWQEDPPRRVALKVLRAADHADPRAVERMRREARALGRISHPHVATIYAAGCAPDGRPFLAMELVHGSTLGAHARTLPLRKRVELFRDVCDAVHDAHRRGVLHRDLKTSNVMVDAALGVKVVDFGLARLLDASAAPVTREGALLGTLGYTSPEQAAGARVDERTDVYSLGVVLYELLADALPFDLEGKSALDAVRTIATRAPPAPSRRAPEVDRDLDTITAKALEKDPDRRYGSAAALSEDLGCWLAGRPILARRPTLGYRARKLVARNRLATALVAIVVLFALVATYASAFRPRFLRLSGEWYATKSPFDGVRWVGDRPHVRVGEGWYELVSIDGLDADYVTGFCKQDAGALWRKRFSEDLLQVLNLMGDWPIRSVDLVLRDPSSGRTVAVSDVPLESAKRRAVLHDRNAWPIGRDERGRPCVLLSGRVREIVSFDGVAADATIDGGRLSIADGYDAFCAIAGRSARERVRVELRDPSTGTVEVLEDVARDDRLPNALAER